MNIPGTIHLDLTVSGGRSCGRRASDHRADLLATAIRMAGYLPSADPIYPVIGGRPGRRASDLRAAALIASLDAAMTA